MKQSTGITGLQFVHVAGIEVCFVMDCIIYTICYLTWLYSICLKSKTRLSRRYLVTGSKLVAPRQFLDSTHPSQLKSWKNVSVTKSNWSLKLKTRIVNSSGRYGWCAQSLQLTEWCSCREVSDKYETFRDVVLSLAQLDCLLSLATVARRPKYVKPTFSDHAQIKVVNGRHPMVEQFLSDAYVANDIDFDVSFPWWSHDYVLSPWTLDGWYQHNDLDRS